MHRAAAQWRIGRFLYNLPQQWVPVDERGRFTQFQRIPRNSSRAEQANARAALGPQNQDSKRAAEQAVRGARDGKAGNGRSGAQNQESKG